MRRTTLFLATCASIAAPHADAQATTIIVPMWGSTPAAPAIVDERIAFFAKRRRAPATSAAFYDIAYPAGPAEYDSLGGHALLLLSILSPDSSRLPPLFAVTRSNGVLSELQEVRSSLSRREKNDDITKAFGRFRQDAIFLLPIPVPPAGEEILVLFADSSVVIAGVADADVPPPVAAYLAKKAARTTPTDSALAAVIKREYPGFLAE